MNKLVQCAECDVARNEEVPRSVGSGPDAVVLDLVVAVENGDGKLVAPRFRFADEEGAARVRRHEELLLGLHALDVAKEPPV